MKTWGPRSNISPSAESLSSVRGAATPTVPSLTRSGMPVAILDATAINVAPLNQVPGAVVSLMDRTNVETVLVAGKIRKWKGRLLDFNIDKLRNDLENSRDYVFGAAGIPQNLFSSQ